MAHVDADGGYTCAHCGGRFKAEHDDAAQAEAVAQWGQRGDAPGMAIICDECYQEFKQWYERTRQDVKRWTYD